jgi:hypothetical protein
VSIGLWMQPFLKVALEIILHAQKAVFKYIFDKNNEK